MTDLASLLQQLNLETYHSSGYYPQDRLCNYFARVLTEKLRHEGIPHKRLAIQVPCAHSLVSIEEGFTCDPTAGVIYPHDVTDLVASPQLAAVSEFPAADDCWRGWAQRGFAGPAFFRRTLRWRKGREDG